MWILYVALIFFVILTCYFFVFPLSKKRPVLIKEVWLNVYLFVLAMVLLQPFEIWTFAILILILLILHLLKPWLIYGVTKEMLYDALEKAALATRTHIEKTENGYKIDGCIRIRQHEISKKTMFLVFRKIGESKKAKLTKIVFQKFIQNYFI